MISIFKYFGLIRKGHQKLNIRSKIISIYDFKQGSASGTRSPGSCGAGPGNLGLGPVLILKSGTGTGTHQRIRDKRDSRDMRNSAKNPGLGPGPGRKTRKSGIRYQNRDSKLKNPGSGTGIGTQICGTRDSGTQL